MSSPKLIFLLCIFYFEHLNNFVVNRIKIWHISQCLRKLPRCKTGRTRFRNPKTSRFLCHLFSIMRKGIHFLRSVARFLENRNLHALNISFKNVIIARRRKCGMNDWMVIAYCCRKTRKPIYGMEGKVLWLIAACLPPLDR